MANVWDQASFALFALINHIFLVSLPCDGAAVETGSNWCLRGTELAQSPAVALRGREGPTRSNAAEAPLVVGLTFSTTLAARLGLCRGPTPASSLSPCHGGDPTEGVRGATASGAFQAADVVAGGSFDCKLKEMLFKLFY